MDRGPSELTVETYGNGQYYAQIDGKIYMTQYDSPRINAFDLQTETFESNWASTPIDSTYGGCVAASPSN